MNTSRWILGHTKKNLAVAIAEDDVGVEAIADHADAVLGHLVLVGKVVYHQRRGLANLPQVQPSV